MGRRKGYDPEHVLTCAMDVFWHKGFAATSISDLEEATDINRKSLFLEFGSKEQLFERVLAHYIDMKAKPDGAPLAVAPPSVDNIRHFFRRIRYTEDELGCLMALTLLEKESVPASAYGCAQQMYGGLEDAFFVNLLPAVESGAIESRAAARSLAKFLLNSLYGIIVSGRAGASNASLTRIVKVVLSVLPD